MLVIIFRSIHLVSTPRSFVRNFRQLLMTAQVAVVGERLLTTDMRLLLTVFARSQCRKYIECHRGRQDNDVRYDSL